MATATIKTPEQLTGRIQHDLKGKRSQSSPLGLLEGDMGRLLFLLEYAKYCGNKKEITLLKKDLIHAFSQVEKNMHNTTFSSGLLGFLSFLDYYNHYSGETLELDTETEDGLCRMIARLMENDLLQRNNYDYMIGAVAAGHYALGKQILPDFVFRLIDYFDTTKTETAQGITWMEPEGIFPLAKRTNTVNLGLAHGIIPVILFLAQCYAKGIEPERTKRLATAGIRFLESHRITDPESAFLYPAFLENGKPKTSRHGWCYGDLGAAMMYLQCSELLQQKEFRDKALETGLFSCRLRSKKITRMEDAAICHGTGGLYLQYLILHRHFAHPDFAETAAYWKKKTIAYSKYDDGPGGYMVPTLAGMQGNPGLLGGAAGIGLSFLYEMNGGHAPWLKFLLLPS